MSIKRTLELLDGLKNLGFNDGAFWRLHHFRDRNHKETIASFRGYCQKQFDNNAEFEPGGTNENVCERLNFVLNTYRGLGLPREQTKVFTALADASYFGIRRR